MQTLALTRASSVLASCAIAASLAAQSLPGHDSFRIDAATLQDLAPDIQAALNSLANPDPENDGARTSRKLFRLVLEEPTAWPSLEQVIDQKLNALERRYAHILDEPIRAEYQRRLTSLAPEELRQVVMTRRIWRRYILETTEQLHFQQHFLGPATAVAKLLLPDVGAIRTKASKEQMQRMVEVNGYRDKVRAALELGPDPSTGKEAPTGIPMPPLSRVRSYEEHLDHLHRTMAIASSVAPRDARTTLLGNAAKARLIDLEEAEFILYANEMRMLMGTLAWSTDILACAADRDHSKDRVEGNASGHMSTLPGKRGFTHRLRRFGTNGRSEGAGGGSSGRGYLHGLSYGGGHTGPLYSMKRNKVGVGRFDNCYTSTYSRDEDATHSCQAIDGDLFMPPGFRQRDIYAASLIRVYNALLEGNYGAAQELLSEAKAKTKLDKFLRRYFKLAIEVEADWRIDCIARIAAVGDLHRVESRLEEARALFGSSLDKRFKAYEKHLQSKGWSRVLQAGRAYAAACARRDRAAIEAIVRDYSGTPYASAAQHHLAATEGGKSSHPLKWFLSEDGYLNRFEYLSK